VNEKYILSLSQSRPFSFVKQYGSLLMMIDAQPLEESRADVTVKQLQDYEKSVNGKLKICNADLICNWDQNGSKVVK